MQYQKDIIIITAAGAKTWLRERLTPSAWGRMFGEAGIAGYKEKMDTLRTVDDRIFEWVKDLHKLVKKMRHAAKTARYVDVAIILSQINNRLQNVKAVGKEIKKETDEDILPFELEHKQELPEGDLFHADDEDDDDEEGLKSEAGLSDMKRRWVAKRLEHDMRAERKLAIKELLNRTEALVDLAQSKLNDLSKARSAGDIGSYIKILNEIAKEQTAFQGYFMPVYNKYLKPLVLKAVEEKKKLENAEKAELAPTAEERGDIKPEDSAQTLPEIPELMPRDSKSTPVDEEPSFSGPIRRIRGPQDLLPESFFQDKDKEPPTSPIVMRSKEEGRQPGAWETAPAPAWQTDPTKFVSHKGIVPTDLQPERFQTGKPTGTLSGTSVPPDPTTHLAGPTVIKDPAAFLMKARQPKAKKPRKPATPPPAPATPAIPEAVANTHVENVLLKVGHQKFIIELFKAADNNDPYLLSAMLVKYAGQIEETDLEKSLQLLAIAEGILDES